MKTEKEFWRPVSRYENLYEVSNIGNVRSVNRTIFQQGRMQQYKGRNIAQWIGIHGYYCVKLSKNNKKKIFLVHRLVAEAFIPNDNNLPIINHKDENRLNNKVDNLEWCTAEYNVNYGTATTRRAIKTGHKIAQYTKRGVFVREFYSIHEAERITRISRQCIHDAISQKHSAGSFFWISTDNNTPTEIDVSQFNSKAKEVEQINDIGDIVTRYKSARDAEQATGIRHEYISRCCRGLMPATGNYKWRYA